MIVTDSMINTGFFERAFISVMYIIILREKQLTQPHVAILNFFVNFAERPNDLFVVKLQDPVRPMLQTIIYRNKN